MHGCKSRGRSVRKRVFFVMEVKEKRRYAGDARRGLMHGPVKTRVHISKEGARKKIGSKNGGRGVKL